MYTHARLRNVCMRMCVRELNIVDFQFWNLQTIIIPVYGSVLDDTTTYLHICDSE